MFITNITERDNRIMNKTIYLHINNKTSKTTTATPIQTLLLKSFLGYLFTFVACPEFFQRQKSFSEPLVSLCRVWLNISKG